MMSYSNTEFENTLIRKIPKEWEVVKLGNKISLEYGKGLTEAERKSGKYPVFGSNGIIGYHNDFLINGPGIVVGRKGTIGAITWSNENFWPIDTTYFVKLMDKNINLKWLFFKLSTLKLSKLNMATGTPGLNRKLAYSKILLFPPLPEQQKIAEILGTVDEAIEKIDKAIEKTERLKKGLMQELLTKGIGHKEFKDTKIGKIPKKWEIKKLSKVFNLASGKSRPKKLSEVKTIEMPYPVYGGNGILGYTDKFITDKETIIIGRVGEYCGSIHEAPKFSWISDNAIYVTELLTNSIDLNFLTSYLILLNLNKFKRKSGQPLMTQTIIYSMCIPQPVFTEQKKIVEILSTVDERIDMEKKRKEKLERVKKGLMDDLLTGRKRVKV